ncbi:MAG TPA: 16S rRNA (cytosine(967)-C(5))-methyltransferase RsmB [Burkholderiaceae bacterium]|nr:16S rRNA (cytosine(967)-C(5))-methyltransferase RsmB [Burkholderiaceae bacterium]
MTTEEAKRPGAAALADALAWAGTVWSQVRAGQSLEPALERVLREEVPAERRDDASVRGAVRDIAAAAVRRSAMLEYLLGQLLHRPASAPVASLLAVCLAQLLARAYTEFTLVDQAVRAARLQASTAAAAALVNAVLREFLRRREQLEAQAAADPARRFNVPAWWLQRLQAEYGADRAHELLAAQLRAPPLVLRVNRRRASPAQVLADFASAKLQASRVGASAIWLHRAMPVDRVPGFAAGVVSVQDAGAQLAAPWLDVGEEMRVLDACAAPGGKCAHLLELGDCRVDAVEVDAQRAARIDANLQRLGLGAGRARVFVADVLRPQTYWDGTPYDRILLDAPCTASGVVRRHPDIPLLRRAADVAKLATQQAKMLDALWPLLAPAGRLLYAVCSVFAEEGREQIASFVRRQRGARRLALPGGDLSGVQLLPSFADDAAKAWLEGAEPVVHDGFFYALLEKI